MRNIEKIYLKEKLVKIRISPEIKEIEKEIKLPQIQDIQKEGLAEIAKKIKDETETIKNECVETFKKIPGIDEEKAVALYEMGYTKLKEIALAEPEKLLTIKNITIEDVKTIKKELSFLLINR